MYLPKHFAQTRVEALHGLIDAHPFATVLTGAGGSLQANHLPFVRVGERLHGHVARGNELARLDGAQVLLVCHGPQGYVSPNWYPGKHEDGRVVPTWNYAVVHVHGRLRVIDDAGWVRAQIDALTERHEADQARPWRVADAPADHVDTLLRAVVGIEVAIDRVEGKFKLSQNHPAANRAGVVAGLRQRAHAGDTALAELMLAQEADL
jgi:transcriptional regulator